MIGVAEGYLLPVLHSASQEQITSLADSLESIPTRKHYFLKLKRGRGVDVSTEGRTYPPQIWTIVPPKTTALLPPEPSARAGRASGDDLSQPSIDGTVHTRVCSGSAEITPQQAITTSPRLFSSKHNAAVERYMGV